MCSRVGTCPSPSTPSPGRCRAAGAPDMVVVMDGAHQEPAWSLGRLDALPETPSASDLELLAALDPADLCDPMDVITYLQRIEKVEAFLAALKVQALVALAGAQASPSSMDEAHVVTEVALARRVGQGSAHTSIDVARALSSTFPQFLTALQAGQISEWHCRELVTATRSVTDPDVRRQVADATLAQGEADDSLRVRSRGRQGDRPLRPRPHHPHREGTGGPPGLVHSAARRDGVPRTHPRLDHRPSHPRDHHRRRAHPAARPWWLRRSACRGRRCACGRVPCRCDGRPDARHRR